MDLAPIVLFVYNRPWHTQQTIEALQKNNLATDSQLFIFSDAPKTLKDTANVIDVRNYIRRVRGFKHIEIIEYEKNKGIEASEIEGITEIINRYGKIIVLEDDLKTSPFFLKFINEGLIAYKDTNVFSVNGFMFPLETDQADSFLCPLATSSWGWGTWQDKWALLEKQFTYKTIIQNNNYIRNHFNFGGFNFHSLLDMETWDIRWYYTAFIRNGLGLFPTKSLVKNIGFDGTGIHYTEPIEIEQLIFDYDIEIKKTDTIHIKYYELILNYFEKKFKIQIQTKNLFHRFVHRIKVLFKFARL